MALFDDKMNLLCTIERLDEDAPAATFGHKAETFETLQTDHPCALQTLTGRESKALKLSAVVTHRIFMRPTDVDKDDRINIDGQKFNVILVEDPMKRGHHYEILAERIDA